MFKPVLTNSTTRTRDGLSSGVVQYYRGEFKILANSKLYKVDAYNYDDYKLLYSLPANNKQEDWTSINSGITNDNLNIDRIKLYWGTLKPNLKVRGIIFKDKFVVKKWE
jgi:hypothetical protein